MRSAAADRRRTRRLLTAALLLALASAGPVEAACAAADAAAPSAVALSHDLGLGTARVALTLEPGRGGGPTAVTLSGLLLPAATSSDLRETLRRRLDGWLARPLRVEPVGRVDRRDRLPADLRDAAGNWLQRDLLAAGLAVLDGRRAPCPVLIAAETEAREARRGVWSDEKFVLPAFGWQKSRLPDFLLLDGRISTVGKAGRTTYLNFGRVYRTDATGRVNETLATELRSAGIEVADLAGRRVLLRGFARAKDGLDLALEGPAALQRLD